MTQGLIKQLRAVVIKYVYFFKYVYLVTITCLCNQSANLSGPIVQACALVLRRVLYLLLYHQDLQEYLHLA